MRNRRLKGDPNPYTTHYIGVGAIAAGASAAASIAGTVGSLVGGSGGGGVDLQLIGQTARDDFRRRLQAHTAFWDKMYPQLSDTQKKQYKKMAALLDQLSTLGTAVYKKDHDKVYRKYVASINKLTNKIINLEKTPQFKRRFKEEELEINRRFAETLQDTLDAHQHAVARGDAGMFSSETMEQSMLRSLAQKRDVAGREAKGDVRRQMLSELTAQIGSKTALLPTYGDLSKRRLAKDMGLFGFQSATKLQKLSAQNALDDYLNKLDIDRLGGVPQKPILGDVYQQWIASLSGQPQGPGSGPGIAQAAGDVNSIIQSLYGLGKRLNWWEASPSTDTGFLSPEIPYTY